MRKKERMMQISPLSVAARDDKKRAPNKAEGPLRRTTKREAGSVEGLRAESREKGLEEEEEEEKEDGRG